MDCPAWLNAWKSDALRRVEELRTKWRRLVDCCLNKSILSFGSLSSFQSERDKLDLEIETTMIDNTYSKSLVDLMKREEALGSQVMLINHEFIFEMFGSVCPALFCYERGDCSWSAVGLSMWDARSGIIS
jgi:hypothetical protein